MQEPAGIYHDVLSRISAAWAKWREVNDPQVQGSDIQEHHLTGSVIRQRMLVCSLASTISAQSRVSHHENENAEVDVRRKSV